MPYLDCPSFAKNEKEKNSNRMGFTKRHSLRCQAVDSHCVNVIRIFGFQYLAALRSSFFFITELVAK
jgi:hypothetical protein